MAQLLLLLLPKPYVPPLHNTIVYQTIQLSASQWPCAQSSRRIELEINFGHHCNWSKDRSLMMSFRVFPVSDWSSSKTMSGCATKRSPSLMHQNPNEDGEHQVHVIVSCERHSGSGSKGRFLEHFRRAIFFLCWEATCPQNVLQ